MAALALFSLAFYISVVHGQGNWPQWSFVVLIVAVAVGAAVGAVLRPNGSRRILLLATTVLALLLGLISIFSVGMPLLITACLGVVALATDSRGLNEQRSELNNK